MTSDTLQPFEQSFMISPRTGQNNDKPSYLFTPPPDTENFLVETFHQYPHGDFRPTFYNPFEIKHRRRTSRAQLKILEDTFAKYTKPSATVRRILAQKLGMSARGVQIWFQNRRAKEKQLKNQQKEEPASEQEDTHKEEPHQLFNDSANTSFDSASSFTIDESSVLFSNFSTPQQPLDTQLPNTMIDNSSQKMPEIYDRKQTISDNVRALATNAAMVAMSNTASCAPTNWPNYSNFTQQQNINTARRRESRPIYHDQQAKHQPMYLSPTWSPLEIKTINTNVQSFDQELNFSYMQQLTPPLSASCAGSTVPGSPISLDSLYTDPVVYPNELYLNSSQPSYLTPVNSVTSILPGFI